MIKLDYRIVGYKYFMSCNVWTKINSDILNFLLEMSAGHRNTNILISKIMHKIEVSNSFISINTGRIDSHSHILCNNEVFKSQSALLKMYHWF